MSKITVVVDEQGGDTPVDPTPAPTPTPTPTPTPKPDTDSNVDPIDGSETVDYSDYDDEIEGEDGDSEISDDQEQSEQIVQVPDTGGAEHDAGGVIISGLGIVTLIIVVFVVATVFLKKKSMHSIKPPQNTWF